MTTSENFRKILKNDGLPYVLISKSTEPIDINFPNMPDKDEGQYDGLPDSEDICFKYKGSDYKVVRSVDETNDDNFGTLYDSNNEKILDIVLCGDTDSIIHSLRTDDIAISNDLLHQVSPYLKLLHISLYNNTEFEYVVFKVLMESDCLCDIDDLDSLDQTPGGLSGWKRGKKRRAEEEVEDSDADSDSNYTLLRKKIGKIHF